ncbi:zona pellucida sperm-binding protein 3 receptor [Lingula anatina]|uniref:Zona pellucida sperm-binding protein 3 receptor n=1 Tax=Lingula anatina TaxID=7574 RepID=A0A1S3ITH7_LINAN|nr:zona pellucida sperm-binding protein 3 receptor [Lingula anatina]|eukprot:XP_013400834.1 zona pellucida sperm-binding protein 3 receptor [Lingula anatina]
MGAVHLSVAAVLFVVTFWQTAATEEGENKYCGEPPQVAFAYRVALAKNYRKGERIRYTCEKGYQHVGGSSYKFCLTGVWVGHNIICEQIAPPTSNLYPGALFDYKRQCCQKGLRARTGNESCATLAKSMCEPCKTAFLKCCPDQDLPQEDVQPMSCSQPPKVAYAYVSAPEKLYEHGGKVHYICLKGYQQTNGSTHKVCENGTWTGEDIGCEKITLPPNPDIDPDALKDYIRMCCLKGLKTKAGSGTCKELSLPMCEPCKTPFLKCCVDKTINIYRSTLYTAITSYSKLLVN